MPPLKATDPRTLYRPRFPLDVMWWTPWTITDPWRPRVFRGCDEWHNKSWALIVPPLGGFVFFRMRYARDHVSEHLNLWTRNEGWEGLYVVGCDICAEVYTTHSD
jgi:hypothetical protein